MRERGPEICSRFPDCIVEISWVFADCPVKLDRDETRLSLHKDSILLPSLEEGLFVRLVEDEHVHEHDGAGCDRELAFDGEGRGQRTQQRHDRLHSIWLYDVDSTWCYHALLTS